MKRAAFLCPCVLVVASMAPAGEPGADSPPGPAQPVLLGSPALGIALDAADGRLLRMESRSTGESVAWLQGKARLGLRNEATGKSGSPSASSLEPGASSVKVASRFPELSLACKEEWLSEPQRIVWSISFEGTAPRAGHEVTLDLPILSRERKVFTPSERGVVSLDFHPSFTPAAYGSNGWGTDRFYVLPLVSVLDLRSDAAVTIALPPDENLPHLQVSWTDAKILRLTLAHRGMGGGRPSPLKLLFYAHAADHRSAIRAYSDDFPRYFKPPLPRGPYEGTFWYHHIQDHPDFEEMARQDVRFIWASFWFTHLGEYLPAETEWNPYTFARWWKLGEKMSDARIRSFVEELHRHGIGTFAYFNVTEYGGAGGKEGDSEAAQRILREQFADALIRKEDGQPIPTWEGAMAMNCGPGYSLFPFLQEQLRRHLTRLPEIDGFCVDRLDWASTFDHGHSDGLTMFGSKEAENMAVPVSQGVAEVCRQAHAAGKRVYVNQFYRIEMLRDVDGYCHEYDYPRGLGYLSPYRPASAWHCQKPYGDDLLAFEAQLKSRLEFALFPQMIAHEFPISQQAPDPEAADMLEVYAPLFAALRGKEQVLLPHCAEVTGANDVNLFKASSLEGGGSYVASVISRVRFLSRGSRGGEEVLLALRVPDARDLDQAESFSADGPGGPCDVRHRDGTAEVVLPLHGTASVVVVHGGLPQGVFPQVYEGKLVNSAHEARARLLPRIAWKPWDLPGTKAPRAADAGAAKATEPSRLSDFEEYIFLVRGEQVGSDGGLAALCGDRELGRFAGRTGVFRLRAAAGESPAGLLDLRLVTGDEGTWFVPEGVWLLGASAAKECRLIAGWSPGGQVLEGSCPGEVRLRLRPCEPRGVTVSSARFAARTASAGGSWRGKMGALGAWIPGVAGSGPHGAEPAGGAPRVEIVRGKPFTWAQAVEDPRVLEAPEGAGTAGSAGSKGRASTCWFDDSRICLSVEPPDEKPYRLTAYLLDHDRNGRSMDVKVSGWLGDLDSQRVSKEESAAGTYVSWVVTGAVEISIEKVEGFNAVASGIFLDPE